MRTPETPKQQGVSSGPTPEAHQAMMAALFRPVGAQSSGGGTAIPRSNPCSPPVVKESLLDQLPGCVGKLYQELEVYVEKERAAELERQLAAATAVVKQEPGIKQEPGMKQEGAGRRQELGLGSRGRERKRRRKSQLAAQRVTRSGTNKRHPSAPPGTPSRNLRSYGDVRGSTLWVDVDFKKSFLAFGRTYASLGGAVPVLEDEVALACPARAPVAAPPPLGNARASRSPSAAPAPNARAALLSVSYPRSFFGAS